jgi:hypothetical protein
MKRIKWLSYILIVLVAGMWTTALAAENPTGEHFNKKLYDKLSKKNIGRIISGNINVDVMMSDMEELLDQGVEGAEAHMNDQGTPVAEANIMKIIIENRGKMTALSLSELEAQWHTGAALKAQGIDISKMDPLGETMRHYELLLNPATAIVCLKQYKRTQDETLLSTVEEHLVEGRDHLKHLGE